MEFVKELKPVVIIGSQELPEIVMCTSAQAAFVDGRIGLAVGRPCTIAIVCLETTH
jgi:hypothetical protein